mgnify:CR=1 FL=1
MLKKIMELSSKFFVALLLGLLVLSFSIWGVGDVFRSNVSDAVAIVGEQEISEGEFRQAMNREVDHMKQNFGDQLTPDVLKSLNIHKRIINQLVNDKLLSQEAQEIGLVFGDKPALQQIASVPQFRNEDGSFNAEAFHQFLRGQGHSEAGFIKMISDTTARQVLIDVVTNNAFVSEGLVKKIYEYENEKRKVSTVILPTNLISEIREPTTEEIADFYEKEKSKFSTMEYRDVSYLVLNSEAVDVEKEINEDSLKQSYQAHIRDYTTPEKRNLLNIIFESKEAADEAYQQIKSGKDFYGVAKDLANQDKAETALGYLAKEDLLPEISEKIFSLAKDEVSEPLESSFGWHVVKLLDIKPEQVEPIEKVKNELRQKLIVEKSEEIVYSLSAKLEDLLAAGSSLEEAANELGLKLNKTGMINSAGVLKERGELTKNMPRYSNFLSVAFATEEGQSSSLEQGEDGKSYFVLKVDEVIEPRTKALDEVKGNVISAWKQAKSRELLGGLAEGVVESLKASGDNVNIEEINKKIKAGNEETQKYSAKIAGEALLKNFDSLKRSPDENTTDYPASFFEEVFALKKGDASGYHEKVNKDLVVGKVIEIISANYKKDADGLGQIEQTLSYDASEDMWEQYLLYLRSKFPVKIIEEKITSE